jgi:hypothetical protein
MRSALGISLPAARRRRDQLALPADEAVLFVPVMVAARKPVGPTPSITIETAGIVVRVECGVDLIAWVLLAFSVLLRLSQAHPGAPAVFGYELSATRL